MIHLDSSFLIDLLRETHRGRPGGALDFVEGLDATEVLAVSVHVVCELMAGVELSRKPHKEIAELDALLSGVLIVYPDHRFAPLYGRLLAALQRSGRAGSAMDLLIATAAVVDDAPLVTRNVAISPACPAFACSSTEITEKELEGTGRTEGTEQGSSGSGAGARRGVGPRAV